MKKWIVAFMGFGFIIGTIASANAGMSIREIENYVWSINNGQNCDGDCGKELEEQFNIKWCDRDGKWNCTDRAAVAIRLLKENGYKSHAEQRVMLWTGETHMYVVVEKENGETLTTILDLWDDFTRK